MSTLWTPDGERPVRPAGGSTPGTQGTPPPGPRPTPPPEPPAGGRGGGGDEPTDEDLAALQALREQLLQAPAAVVIANHAFGLFELAALHLSQQPPSLDEARLAIDALAGIVEGLAGRLGEGEAQLAEGLAQLRLAFVQISAMVRAAEGQPPEA